MVMRGNALQIAPNHAKLREKMYSKVRSNTVKLWKHFALWPIHVKLREHVQ